MIFFLKGYFNSKNGLVYNGISEGILRRYLSSQLPPTLVRQTFCTSFTACSTMARCGVPRATLLL